jgi:hypothetical protein
VGWEDRDWAKWTDDERSRFFGGGGSGVGMMPGALLGIVVSLVGAVVFMHPFRARHVLLPPVYGTGVVVHLMNQDTTCTMQSREGGKWQCMRWAILLRGQRALPALPLPTGSLCSAAVVDQPSHRWICATPS